MYKRQAQKRRRQPREQNAAHQIATDDKNQFPDHTNLPVYALKWNPSATIIRAAPRNAIDNCGLFVQQSKRAGRFRNGWKRPARCFAMDFLPRIGREIPATAPFEIAHGVQLTGHFPIVRIIRVVIPLDLSLIHIFGPSAFCRTAQPIW